MATESPIRIIEASGKWPSHNNNNITPFGKSLTNMGIEDLGLLLNGQKFEKNSNLAPNRSGSAPPSIEGSFAAIENLIFRQNFATNSGSENIHESEEQLRADPSYFEYYWAHVNLNPRLPPPLVSGENRNLFRNIRSTGNNRRLTSFDDSFDGLLHVDHSNLSTHKEESDDDRSPKQEDHPRAQSPINNHEDSDPTTATISSSSSLDGRAGIMPVKLPENDISSIKIGIAALNISNFPNLESLNQRDQQQEPVFRQQKNAFQIPGAGPPIVSPAQTYQFLQNPANLTPQSYATDPAYLTNMPSGNPVLANMVPPGYFSQQYNTLGGYGFNPLPFSPYATGYFPNGPFETGSPSFSGQCQTFNNFYGNLGLPVSFLDDPKPQSLESMGHINLNSRRVGPTSPYYFGNPTNMDFLQFPISPLASPVMPGSPMGGAGFASRRNRVIDDPKTYSFLEELKSGKGRRLELSEICGLIVEFSADQHGSRFIQQKLEVCSDEEKESVFKEVLPHASRLITDVFGNYVIQKFFEYGSAEQKRELGNQLEGQILSLSLQMYGCRVIQKALDAIELEQKTKLVHELDGHILKCVRDQNGNHVIQKCIESIPTEKIKFVISSFRGQVAALSTHPYGCRVIQRVLEHSTDELHGQFIVGEILDSAYDLAQDQYGNYVTQHVLERGNPEERSQIIHKLAGRIVQLSQHKFASNVIEKCLEYSDSASREFMIEEIIGFGDGSDNLLVMVKDQFANYVVQKVLQICTGNQREVLLARIKTHLNSLKKYTYGKHIVARLEQLYGEEIQASGS